MSIVLNSTVLLIGIIWFQWIIKANKMSKLGLIIPSYFLATFVTYLISFAMSHEYLDGALHLVSAMGSLFLFWLWTSIGLINHNIRNNTQKNIIKDLFRVSPLILTPLIIFLWLRTGSFKIGG